VSTDVDLSLVIPAFNEAQRLEASFGRLLEVVVNGTIDDATTEFIVVDDGSTDGTADLARSLLAPVARCQVLRSEVNLGKGSAIRIGIQASIGRHIVFTDADMAMDPSQIPRIAKALEHADLAIASRAIQGRGIDYGSRARNTMGRWFNRLVNLMTGIALEDTQCGLKGFHASVARLLFHSKGIERFAFDVEILALARKLGLTIAEVPVNWTMLPGAASDRSPTRSRCWPTWSVSDSDACQPTRSPYWRRLAGLPLTTRAGKSRVGGTRCSTGVQTRMKRSWYPGRRRGNRRPTQEAHRSAPWSPVVKGFTTYTQLIEQAPYSLEV